jgi:hypothetical protein
MDYFIYAALAVFVLGLGYLLREAFKKKAIKRRRNRLINKSAEERVLACFTATEKMVFRECKSISNQCGFSMAHTYRTLSVLKDRGVLVSKNEGKKLLYAKVIAKAEQPLLVVQQQG